MANDKGKVQDVEVTKVTSKDLKESLGGGKEKVDGAINNMTNLQHSRQKIQKVVEKLKDVSRFQSKDDVSGFADEVKEYLSGVLDAVAQDTHVQSEKSAKNHVDNLKQKLEELMGKLQNQNNKSPFNFGDSELKKYIDDVDHGEKGAIKQLYKALPAISKNDHPVARALVFATYNGAVNFSTQLRGGYKSSYQGATIQALDTPTSSDATKCVKILLSCLPLIFSYLQHLYWKCKHDNAKGGWSQQLLNGSGNEGADLKHFMDLMTFSSVRLNGTMTGDNVVRNAFKDFTEFTASGSSPTYAAFLKNLKEKPTESVTAPTTNPLSALFYCSKAYFQCCQAKVSQTRPPSSIREMLYWLMGLTATPQFVDLLGHIDNVVGKDFKVAVSGSSKTGETLSPDQVTSYILSTCYTCPSVLNIIQGSVPPNGSGDEPWLHGLYSNATFPFQYPSSGAALFYGLSDYTYALQFQLGFLYQQCSQLYVNMCGWFMCNYGQGVNTNSSKGKVVSSHICPAGCTKQEHKNSDKFSEHKSGDCEHDGCGTANNRPSPLQAFLSDNLKGFSRGHPSGHSHHLATCSGRTCHVPMGFDKRLRPGRVLQGGHISLTLTPLCGSYTSPLPQLSEKLGCLTKRTPRTLGDLFGFTWHLNGQLFKGGKTAEESLSEFFKSIGFSNYSGSSQTTADQFFQAIDNKIAALKSSPPPKAIEKALSLFPGLPFWYNLFMIKPDDSLPARLFRVKSTDHNTRGPSKYTGEHNDLYSLYNQMCNIPPNNTCGKYLHPLCYSNGATYAPKHAITYLSWVLYLTDDLQYKFQKLLDDFTKIDCSNSGCGGLTKCAEHHASGTHGTSCTCPSVVQCGGVLPLLYGHGFRSYDAIHLKNGSKGNGGDVRKCSAFAAQLKSVLAGKPLTNLLTSIDAFLFAIRWEFFSKLSGFWTIYIGLILYTFFFLLDTLHVRSHLKLTSSHTVPPLALLTSGKPLPITQLTYIGQ
ncbi:variant erythrocyte surface antigen-1 family protein [Babesia caballi]|uniref:Variant erythrocyte surface antigen-1 family protein n=1 Tax=Babesia caballi TaxID=5871 RepID=A0AAV4LVR8_BABCB|nr:variant erythrocyte surface antigen-1 family protein [Babesia caballi]